MSILQKEKELKNNTKPSTPIPIWNDYNHYHDFFITLLSYERKNNTIKHDIWDFEYV